MKCAEELNFLVLVVNDYINTLPASSKIAIGEKSQDCFNKLEAALNKKQPKNED